MLFQSMEQIQKQNRKSGFHFFDHDTLDFFSSKIHAETFTRSKYFVTSERSGFDRTAPRRFTVREAKPDGDITTVGEFLQYATKAAAADAIKTGRIHSGVNIEIG